MYWPVILMFAFVFVLISIVIHRMRAIEEGRIPSEGCRYGSPKSLWFFVWYLLFIFRNILYLIAYNGSVVRFLPSLISFCLIQCLLFLLLPLLRKIIISRTCASLWTLLAYCIFPICFLFANAPGLWTIPLPFRFTHPAPWLQYIWLIGYLAIMGWFLFSHFHFRSKLLKACTAITDERILALWKKELELARYPKKPFLLYASPVTQTPLSIGLFHRSTVVVLPEKAYSEEDLKLILRHELIHICRYDTFVKFVIMTFSAFLWFNPLMWISMRSCFNDLELSCDETVLFGYAQGPRRRYANLLLNTVADQRGFTTCLSASSRSLLYRLKNVMKPKKQLTGGIAAGLFLCLVFCAQLINYSYNPGTVQEHIFQNDASQEYVILDGTIAAGEQVTHTLREDNPALTEYLFQLQASPLMKESSFRFEGQIAQIVIDGQDMKHTLYIRDGLLWVRTLSKADNGYDHRYYRIDEPLDWAYLCKTMEIYR